MYLTGFPRSLTCPQSLLGECHYPRNPLDYASRALFIPLYFCPQKAHRIVNMKIWKPRSIGVYGGIFLWPRWRSRRATGHDTLRQMVLIVDGH